MPSKSGPLTTSEMVKFNERSSFITQTGRINRQNKQCADKKNAIHHLNDRLGANSLI